MSWDTTVDAATKKALFEKKVATPQPTLDPNVATNLSNVKQRASWVPVETQVALAKAGASNQAIDAVGKMAAQKTIDVQGTPESSNWFDRNIYSKAKAASRWLTAGLDFVPEFAQGAIAQGFDDNSSIDGWFISTKLGSMVKSAQGDIDPNTGLAVTAGEGWFVGEDLLKRQAERARRYRGTINGSAFTVGRAAANTVFKANTVPYNIFSGIIDGLIMIKTDPTGPITHAIKEYKDVTTLVPRLTQLQVADLRAALFDGAGIIPGLADVGLNETKYAQFMERNGRARQLVSNLREETDAVKIMDQFDQNPNISNEMLDLLAKAKTDDEVKSILGVAFSLTNGALTDEIRTLQAGKISSGLRSIGGNLIERTPLAGSKLLKKGSQLVARYLTEKPERALIISGDQRQNSNAVKSIINYLRTVGASDETVSAIGAKAIKAFTANGTRADQKATLNIFDETIRETLRMNKIAPEIIDEVMTRGKTGVSNLRAYMLDRLGFATDNGFGKVLLNKSRDYLPAEEIDSILSTIGKGGNAEIISPLHISELLQRTQVLPDPRELRRLTSNRFFGIGEKVGSIAGNTTSRLVTTITDEKTYDLLSEQVAALKKQIVSTTLKGENEAIYAEIKKLNAEKEALKVNVLRRVRTGEQRGAVAAMDLLQNEIWKPLSLMTGGYVVRNSIDAQVRMAFSNLPSVFVHPGEYIQLVLGTTKRSTLKGELLTDLPLEEYVKDVREAMTFGLRAAGMTEKDAFDHLVHTNDWSVVSREKPNGLQLHTDAVSQNGAQIHSDPLMKIAAQTFIDFGGVTNESRKVAASRMRAAIKDDPELYNQIKRNFANGVEMGDVKMQNVGTEVTSPILFDNLQQDEVDHLLDQYIYRVNIDHVQMMTGGVYDVEFAYAFNRIPLRDAEGNLSRPINMVMSDVEPMGKEQSIRAGSTVITNADPNKPTFGVITKLENPDTLERYTGNVKQNPDDFVATIQPVVHETVKDGQNFVTAFGDNGLGSRQFRKIVINTPNWDGKTGLPFALKRERLAVERNTKGWRKSMDVVTNKFFGDLYGSVTRKLERSPVFRNFYYKEVGKYADELSPEGAQEALDLITAAAKEAEMSVEKYVGNKKILTDLDKALKGKGTASLEELDSYAKHASLEQTKGLLYDASAKSNLEDAMRIIAPFASAWKEIIGTYAHVFAENPLGAYRNTTRIYNGLAEADPDNDGRGFFFNDPVTNVMSFMFPGSGTLAQAVTGLNAPLKAPVSRLSQGLQVYPALGPFMQLAASTLIPDTPKTDKIVSLLLPYGKKDIMGTVGAVVPGYLQKTIQALTRNEGKMDTVYANTYVETLRALSDSGDYDLKDPDSVKKLQSDAKGKAQWLTGFRALSQFIGPTAGSTEFKVPTKQGDIFVSELIKEFYALQTKDYDSAVSTFLDQFGDQVSLYISSKSKSSVQGLEATEQFGDWERSNKGLLKDFPDVSAYLAPGGDDFSFTVWERQIRQGKRIRLSDKEIIDLAQQRIGASKYRWARQQVGPYPNESNRSLLKQYRAVLHNQYPGFPLVAEFKVGEYENQVEQMRNLVNDSRVADNVTANSIKTYLELRDYAKKAALAQFGSDNIKQSKQTQPLRDKLASMGEMLIQQNPEFARVWQRFLSYEVED